jgi:hypothetical protein
MNILTYVKVVLQVEDDEIGLRSLKMDQEENKPKEK